MEAPPSTVDGHHRATHRTTRIDLWYPGRMYVSGRVDIFDMVDIDLFTVVALNMMVLKLGYTGESEPMFYNYLRPLTSLDEGLYALACEEDVRCLATLVRSFKLIEVYIEHGVTVLDSYLRAPRFRATLEDITDEPAGSIVANRTEKMLLLTWHESSETTKEPVCDSVTPSSLPQHDSSTPCKDSVCESITPRCMPDCILTPPTDESVIDDVMRQLSFDETELDGEAGFADVTGSDVGPTQEPILAEVRTQEPIVAEVSTQEPIVAEVSIEAPIVEKVRTQEFNVEDVVIEDYVSFWEDGEDAEQGNGQEDESARTDGEFFSDDEGIDTTYETKYDVQSSEDAGTNDDNDVDKVFLVDEENEIVEPDVDVHLFGISMDLPFDNIGITNLVSDDVLEGEDVDVINADGFDSDPGNNEERNYRKRRLAKLRTKMEGVINASGQWKYSFYTGQKFNTPKEAKDKVYLHSIESRRNLKLYKNDSVRIRARCEGKVPRFIMSQCIGQTSPNRGMEAGSSGTSGPTTRSKKKKNTGTNDDSQASPSFLDAHDKRDLCPWVLYLRKDKFTQNWVVKTHKDTHTFLQSREINHCTYKFLSEKIFKQVRVNLNILVKAVQDQLQRELEIQISMSKAFRAKAKVERNTDPSLPTRVFQRIYVCLGALKSGFRACRRDLLGLDGAFMKGQFPRQCLGDEIDLHPNSNFTIISDRQKGIISAIKTIYPSVEHRYCLRHIHENIKQGWCGQAYKDLLWRAAYSINVRDFEKCTLELKTMNPKEHEWLNKIPTEHWARSHFSGRAKSDLLLNNICEVFNGKIVRGGNNAEAGGSASRQAQQTELAVGQDGSGGSGAGAVLDFSAAGEGAAGGPSGAGVARQGRTIEGLGAGGYLGDYVRVVGGTDDGDFDSDLLIPTPWSDESKNEKGSFHVPKQLNSGNGVQEVPVEGDEPRQPRVVREKTYVNTTPENKNLVDAEVEAIHMILSRIGNDIYSTMDACPTAREM
ncbi:heat stress transcription factor B-4-like protein [Tanacetum coccineum]|uniref:Heat stress transcription factor B-4-like protein n=1 Tax=Tanacetum coccineum TaxID=301880 RepID=A0ABQ5H2J0_9ASTR